MVHTSLVHLQPYKSNFIRSLFTKTYMYVGRSFVELVQYVFDIPSVDSFLSQCLCQDPLERFFGCQRQRGRVHDNPNAADFIKNTQAIRVIGSLPYPDKGNCRGSCGDVDVFHSEPWKKRRSSGKQEPAVSANAPAAEDGRTCTDFIC